MTIGAKQGFELRASKKSLKSPKSGLDAKYEAASVALMRFAALPDIVLSDLANAEGMELDRLLGRILDDPFVSEALFIASPDLHGRLIAWRADKDKFPHSRFAMAQYIQRMSSRATPFGLFAGVCSVETRAKDGVISLPETAVMRRSVRLDASAVLKLGEKILKTDDVKQATKFFGNGTFQAFDDVAHFVAMDVTKSGRRRYRLVEVELSEHVEFALQAAGAGITIRELKNAFATNFQKETEEEISEFVESLIEQQLLCSDHFFKVTSGNLLNSLIEELTKQRSGQEASALVDLQDLLRSIEAKKFDGDVSTYRGVRAKLSEMGLDHPLKSTAQVDLYATLPSHMGLDESSTKKIEEMSTLLLRWGKNRSPSFQVFSERFSERYGDTAVPLLEVLDESGGIGFSNGLGARPLLAALVTNAKRSDKSDTKSKSLVRNQEIDSWFQQRDLSESGLHYITITDAMAERMTATCSEVDLPAQLTVWCSIWRNERADTENVVEIRNVSTQPAGKVFGRFAAEESRILKVLADASIGQSDDIVAEIVHLPPDRLGNVVCRPQLSEWEIEIRSGGSALAKKIELKDILVSVNKGRVVLFSKSMQRRIRPQMSNAHRYGASDSLHIYHFLNAVAEQDFPLMPFSLRSERDRNEFNPGLVYKGVILARPQWLLGFEDLEQLRRAHRNDKAGIVAEWRTKRHLPAWISLVEKDRVLPFNLDSDWMVESLIKSLSKASHAELRDLNPLGLKPAVMSSRGFHHTEVLVPLKLKSGIGAARVQCPQIFTANTVMPIWSEWLYLNIYCHPELQNAVLYELEQVVAKQKMTDTVSHFIFVRYKDAGGAHIRLRLKASRGQIGSSLLAEFAPTLQNLKVRGSITTVTQMPYVREVTRYGGEHLCEYCEEIFSIDSSACMEILQSWNQRSPDAWHIPIAAIDAMLGALGMNKISEKLEFASRAAADFSREFSFDSTVRKSIGQVFRKSEITSGSGSVVTADEAIDDILQKSCQEISRIWTQVEAAENLTEEKKYQIRWSIVHMRANRLFDRESRIQEAVSWDLLRRAYFGGMAKEKRVYKSVNSDD